MSVMDPLSATKTTTTANNIIPTPSSEHDKWLIKALAAILTRRIIAVQDEINRDEADQIDKMEVAVVNEEYEMGGVVDNIGRTGNVLVASAAAAAASKLERRNSIIKNPIKHELVLPLLNYLLADNEGGEEKKKRGEDELSSNPLSTLSPPYY